MLSISFVYFLWAEHSLIYIIILRRRIEKHERFAPSCAMEEMNDDKGLDREVLSWLRLEDELASSQLNCRYFCDIYGARKIFNSESFYTIEKPSRLSPFFSKKKNIFIWILKNFSKFLTPNVFTLGIIDPNYAFRKGLQILRTYLFSDIFN